MPRILTAAAAAAQRAAGANNFPNIQLFDASGTFTPPAGVSLVFVSGCGGGGGGGGTGSSSLTSSGGGGGASCYRVPVLVTPGVGVTVTVGAGGTSGAGTGSGGVDGGSGGTSSFGSAVSLPGGHAGGAASTSNNFVNRTTQQNFASFVHPLISQANADQFLAIAGASPMPLFMRGQDGQQYVLTVPTQGGRGGASLFSSPVEDATAAGNGISGRTPPGYGAGGRGRNGVSVAGDAGTGGVIIVEW